MAVLEPLKITIENYPNSSAVKISVPNFPNDESKGTHEVTFDKVVYIDATDFQEVRLHLITHFYYHLF
jgi:glutaminyl-tRNA synthetase